MYSEKIGTLSHQKKFIIIINGMIIRVLLTHIASHTNIGKIHIDNNVNLFQKYFSILEAHFHHSHENIGTIHKITQ